MNIRIRVFKAKVSKLNVDIKMDPSVSDDLGGYYSFGKHSFEEKDTIILKEVKK